MGPLETATDFFIKLREQNKTEKDYIDAVWTMRYPDPFPKSSSGWPYRGLKDQEKQAEEQPEGAGVTAMRKRAEPEPPLSLAALCIAFLMAAAFWGAVICVGVWVTGI